jgi:hypothetical protein
MTITITAEQISCDHRPPRADVTVSGDEYDTWTVGWLTVGPHETYTLSRWSPQVQNQTGEQGSAAADAAARTSITPHLNAGVAGGTQ